MVPWTLWTSFYPPFVSYTSSDLLMDLVSFVYDVLGLYISFFRVIFSLLIYRFSLSLACPLCETMSHLYTATNICISADI